MIDFQLRTVTIKDNVLKGLSVIVATLYLVFFLASKLWLRHSAAELW